MLERGSKIFGCFLDVRKAFDTVWINCLLYKLFHEFYIKGRIRLALKDLYTDITVQVLYDGSLSRAFDVLQGTGQGRIIAPFMYKIYTNCLLTEINNHSFAIVINRLTVSSHYFVDAISLLPLYPSFLQTFMDDCYDYSLKWTYEFNNTNSGTMTFGEDKRTHCTRMNEREWKSGLQNLDELYACKNLGVTKNYISSSVSEINDNIEKTRKKAGMIFSANFDRRKVNPLIYIKFWRHACVPSLLDVNHS